VERELPYLCDYILNEMPNGLRGLVTVGAHSCSTLIYQLRTISMASVAVEDIYRDIVGGRSERHYLNVSRFMVILFATSPLTLCGIVSYYCNTYSSLPLLILL